MGPGVTAEHDAASAFRNSEESGQDRQFGKVYGGKVSEAGEAQRRWRMS